MNENGISSINGLGSILEFLLTYHYVKCVGSDPESYYSTNNTRTYPRYINKCS